MDDPSKPRIEIFAPFEQAFEITKQILFRPFDLKKWFVIGFPAWLATFFSGGGGGGNIRNWSENWKTQHQGTPFSLHEMPPWLIPVMICVVLFALAFIVLLVWLNSRGQFMFTDCIVRNRGAVAEPWREYRTEGNRYFVFKVVITLCGAVVFGGIALIFVLGHFHRMAVVPLVLLILSGIAFFVLLLVLALLLRFMIPVMYRQRCDAMSALRQVWGLVSAHPGIFVLFALFYIVLALAAAMVGCLAACVTCCIAALPYIGTVILLPVVMFLFTYPLCFVRQFGDPFDVWAVLPATEPPPPIPPLPPVPLPPA